MKTRILGVTAMIGVLAAAPHAFAQSRPATAEDCAQMPTAEAELACLRQALTESQALLSGGAEPAQQEADPEQSGGGLSLPRIPFFGRGDDGGGRQPVAAAPTPAPAEKAPTAGFGAEQVAVARGEFPESRRDDDRLTARVVGFETDRRGMLTVELDNGQVWRQAERLAIPVRLDDEGANPVELTQSGFGGYRMRFTDINRRIVVQRVR